MSIVLNSSLRLLITFNGDTRVIDYVRILGVPRTHPRANLYFGLRPRVPNTLMTGLMWHGLNDYQSILSACCRHSLPRSEGYLHPS